METKMKYNKTRKSIRVIQIILFSYLVNISLAQIKLPNVTEMRNGIICVYDRDYEIDKSGKVNSSKNYDSLCYSVDTTLYLKILADIDSIWDTNNKGVFIGACLCGLSYCGIISYEFKHGESVKIYWTCPESPLQGCIVNNTTEIEFTINESLSNELKKELNQKRYAVLAKDRLWDCLYLNKKNKTNKYKTNDK